MKKISYDGNEQENYDLFVDNKKVAELLVGEDGAIEMVEKIKTFLSAKFHEIPNNNPILVIQNDNDNLGVIVDLYDDNDWWDGITLWFEDFAD